MSAPTDGPGSYGPPGPPVQPGQPYPAQPGQPYPGQPYQGQPYGVGHQTPAQATPYPQPSYPAASQPSYPPPPQPYPTAPQPSWSMGSQHAPSGPVPPLAPAPDAPRSRRPLVIVAVLLGVAIIFAGTYVIGRLTAPTAPVAVSSAPTLAATRTSTSAKASASTSTSGTSTRVGFTLTGATLSGPGFTARMPSGWTLGSANGDSTNDGEIENGTDNSIAFFATDPSSAASRCSNAAGSFRSKLGGTVVDLPNVPWANGTAVVKELETKYSGGQAIGIDIYCVDRANTTSAAILSIASPEHQATNRATAEALIASWAWR